MKTCLITLCYNEIDILPFVAQYWERIADKVVVYDNGSTDGSIEFLQSLPYVELRHFDSEGQNDLIQKTIKEDAYKEFKDEYDIIVICDMDECFYFNDFDAVCQRMIDEGYNVVAVPNYGLCEESKPQFNETYLLHEQCHMFYKQKLNHMKGYGELSKLSIFNTKVTDNVAMSVGQHFVYTLPNERVMFSKNGFCLHIDKGFGCSYKFKIRQKMNENLSKLNKQYRMCIEYGKSYEELEKEYVENQKNSIDINKLLETDAK